MEDEYAAFVASSLALGSVCDMSNGMRTIEALTVEATPSASSETADMGTRPS
jgi:hypothetical protein